ncbi:MAG: hypothetical protein ACTJHC_05155 [Vagococcus sp.]
MGKQCNRARRVWGMIGTSILFATTVGLPIQTVVTAYAEESYQHEQTLDDTQLEISIKEETSSDMRFLFLPKMGDLAVIEFKLTQVDVSELTSKNPEWTLVEDDFLAITDVTQSASAVVRKEKESRLIVRYKHHIEDEWGYVTDETGVLLPTSPTEDSASDSTADTSRTEQVEEISTTTTETSQEQEPPQVAKPRARRAAPMPTASARYTDSFHFKGAITVSDIFAKPNGTISIAQKGNNNIPYSELIQSGQENWNSIWSKPEYKLDFSTSFEGRNYVNFGTSVADGFAFVMHNDKNTTKAVTKAQNSSRDGQNLGVYGENGSYRSGWRTPDMQAIQHSVAVEFDLHHNDSVNGNNANAYDVGIDAGPHMAYTFPGSLSKGYQPMIPGTFTDTVGNGWFPSNRGQNARIKHNGLVYLNQTVSDNVQNGQWFEFRYQFDKETNQFSYYLKNPETNQETPKMVIPWSDLESELELSHNGNKAFWGFTAANGKAVGKTSFVFTQPPVDLKVMTENSVWDKEHHNVSSNKDSLRPDFIASGESATVQTKLSVKDGEESLVISRWETELDPTVVVLDSTRSTMKMTAFKNNGREIKGTTKVNQYGQVSFVFDSPVEMKPGESITLSYDVKTQQLKEKTSFFSSVIVGKGVSETDDRAYGGKRVYYRVYTPNEPTHMSWQSDKSALSTKVSIDKVDSLVKGLSVPFYWQDSDKGNQLEFRVMKQNKVIQTIPLGHTSGVAGFVKQEMTIPDAELDYGSNEFTIQAYRQYADGTYVQEEETLALSVDVLGKLVFKTAPTDLRWTGRRVRESKGVLDRDTSNTLTLSVQDSRQGNHHWTIGASVIREVQAPKFSLIWKSDDQVSTTLNGSQRSVLSKDQATKDGLVYTKTWDNRHGVLLQSDQYLRVGNYSRQFTVNWNLYDTEQPD